MGNQQPKNIGETSSNNIIVIHCTIKKDIYKKVDNILIISEKVKFITNMVQNNDFKSVLH
jgi:hypothetical protein